MLSRRQLILGGTLAATSVLADETPARALRPAMHRAAADFLATLDPDQRQKALFVFNSDERMNWHYVPMDRKGLPYKEMTAAQKEAARSLLATGLSKSGFSKVDGIRQLENVLKAMENGNPGRNPELHYFTVFGEPSALGAWAWRYEGHHVSMHWTIIKGKVIASTPQFLGSNPADVRDGALKGTRILAAEEDLGRALVKALDADQRISAVVSDTAPPDIMTAAARKAALLEDKGLAYGKMTRDQQGILMSLLHEYATVQTPEISSRRLEAVRKAGLESIRFAWMGGLDKGQPHYYRVQGGTFLVEYDNTQNDANHIHCVWRDFNGDFGADLIAMHYRTADHDHGHDA